MPKQPTLLYTPQFLVIVFDFILFPYCVHCDCDLRLQLHCDRIYLRLHAQQQLHM